MIAIDFDGVLIDHPTYPTRKDWWHDRPVDYAREAVDALIEAKEDIYILTARPRSEHKKIREWLKFWDFPALRVGNLKREGTKIFIDDRAVRFTNWPDIAKLLI